MLAMGTVRVLLSLPMLGMWSPPKLLFNSQAQRYDQRFASFHTLQRPDPLAYEQYVASTDVTGAEAEVLLKLAQDNFAKVGWLYTRGGGGGWFRCCAQGCLGRSCKRRRAARM
jgi:hypothetical protein